MSVWMLALPSVGMAQTGVNPSAPQPVIEQQRQQERERALREQNERAVDVHRPKEQYPAGARLPEGQTPCYRIERITLAGERSEQFQWVLQSLASLPDGQQDSPLGRCLGTEGINTVLARGQQALIARGYVTTRVLAAPQDLTGGALALTLVPGRIAEARLAPEASTVHLANALPVQADQLLNLRDIEQGLENLKRLPTAEADIQIAPAQAAGSRPGDSDLIVKYRQKLPLRASLGLDDSGTRATGRTQGALTLAWDGPLHLSDLFYISLNHDLFNHSGQGTRGGTVHYSIPWGNWLLGATWSQSQYHQRVAGLTQDYTYSGESSNGEIRLARMLYRDQQRKTSASVRAWGRSARNYVDDTEIEVQHRIVGGWEAGLAHREYLALPAGQGSLDASVLYRQGTGAFGAIEAPEQAFGEGTSRMRLAQADLALNLPFALGSQRLRYALQWRAQWNATPLTPQDRFAIGGRYSVRGFDGESALLGERGWLVRNDIGWALPGVQGAELYLGLDWGHVGGRSTRELIGQRLAGGVLGLRGALGGLNYDLFAGAPIAKPEGYRTSRISAGFSLNYTF